MLFGTSFFLLFLSWVAQKNKKQSWKLTIKTHTSYRYATLHKKSNYWVFELWTTLDSFYWENQFCSKNKKLIFLFATNLFFYLYLISLCIYNLDIQIYYIWKKTPHIATLHYKIFISVVVLYRIGMFSKRPYMVFYDILACSILNIGLFSWKI